MKTWTNPTVEELEVKMTANGWVDSYWETWDDILPGDQSNWQDEDFLNDSKKDKTQS